MRQGDVGLFHHHVECGVCLIIDKARRRGERVRAGHREVQRVWGSRWRVPRVRSASKVRSTRVGLALNHMAPWGLMSHASLVTTPRTVGRLASQGDTGCDVWERCGEARGARRRGGADGLHTRMLRTWSMTDGIVRRGGTPCGRWVSSSSSTGTQSLYERNAGMGDGAAARQIGVRMDGPHGWRRRAACVVRSRGWAARETARPW